MFHQILEIREGIGLLPKFMQNNDQWELDTHAWRKSDSGIFIKTGTKKLSGTDGNVELKICDQQDNCCKTSDDLDNQLDNFESGDTDVFTSIDMLGECAKVYFLLFRGQKFIQMCFKNFQRLLIKRRIK